MKVFFFLKKEGILVVFAHVSWAGTIKHLILQQNQALLYSEEIMGGKATWEQVILSWFLSRCQILFQTQSHSVVTGTLQAIATRPQLQTANDTGYVFQDNQDLVNRLGCH